MARRIPLSEEEVSKDRLAYVGTLAGGLAHEVRTPLSSILLNVEMIERAGPNIEDHSGQESFYTRVSRIKKEIEHLQKTLNEFLHFTRPPKIRRFATKVEDFLHEMMEFIHPELEEQSINLSLECGEHTYPILIDRAQISQVMKNLVFNARDALKDSSGGQIQIRTIDEEHTVRIEVEDNGPGIQEDDLPHVFEAFFTTKDKGTGLGLGIAQRIAHEHGGSLEVKSPLNNGRGALFSLHLPKEKLLTQVQEEF